MLGELTNRANAKVDPRQLLIESFHAALSAVDAEKFLADCLPPPPMGRTAVVGAGKAAAAMARSVEQRWPKAAPLDGLVTTRYGHGLATNRIQVVEAGHPLPDESGAQAARRMLRIAAALGHDDLLLVLVSGGGSSLLSVPADRISMEDFKTTTSEMLRRGVPIQEMNVVRKHLSDILGGRLAAATKAPTVALILSDVPGDEPTDVASGPCAPDPSTFDDALKVLKRHGVQAPDRVIERLTLGARGGIEETPKPGSRLFAKVENRVVAAAKDALRGAAAYFASKGIDAVILGDSVSGETSDVARAHGTLARQVSRFAQPRPPPLALISGGECTVTVSGDGRGGRCTQYLLALALDLAGAPGVWALACDTDGIDGSEENAGAVLTPDALVHGARLGLNAAALAANNDAWSFFHALDALVVTGPTLTNVSDYRVLLIL